MREYEINFESANSAGNPKRITALVVEPDTIGPRTGASLFSHGWGNNRFQDLDKMRAVAEPYDVIGISVEYRQSGYDADPTRGSGWDCPYDFSFYQMFDVLNGLRQVLALHPEICRGRLFHYGGSQGGHLALLGTLFAPGTFAAVYSSCGAVMVEPHFEEWAGREFQPHERAIRDVLSMAGRITCPVFLDHGTEDKDVDCDRHTRALEARLLGQGTNVTSVYYEGAGHMLDPVTSRYEAFMTMAPQFLQVPETSAPDAFAAGRVVTLPCEDRQLVIDWGETQASEGLFRWEAS